MCVELTPAESPLPQLLAAQSPGWAAWLVATQPELTGIACHKCLLLANTLSCISMHCVACVAALNQGSWATINSGMGDPCKS